MKIPKVSSILSLGLLAAGGYTAYKFLKGDWKLPSLPSLPPLPTPDPQTIAETGIVGGAGDVIYQIFQAPDLRERVTERAADPEIPFSKAVAEVVSEDIHKEGLLAALLKAPITIGAGAGAIVQQGRYLDTLEPMERTLAEREESAKRLQFKQTPEGQAATLISSIFPPLGLVTTIVDIIDVGRVSAPMGAKPTLQEVFTGIRTPTPPAPVEIPTIIRTPLFPEPVSAVKEFATSPILDRLRVLKGLNR